MASTTMPSKRKQLNVRLDLETEKLVSELLPVMRKAIGLELSQSDLFRLGMIELRKKYAAEIEEKKSKRS